MDLPFHIAVNHDFTVYTEWIRLMNLNGWGCPRKEAELTSLVLWLVGELRMRRIDSRVHTVGGLILLRHCEPLSTLIRLLVYYRQCGI